MRAQYVTLCLLPLLLVGVVVARAQGQGRYPAGLVRDLQSSEVDSLRTLLHAAASTNAGSAWAEALRYYFGDTYTAELADFVVFIPVDSAIAQALVYKGDTRRRLPGQKFLYSLVFTESPLPRASSPPGPSFCGAVVDTGNRDSLSGGMLVIHRASLDYRPSPFLRRLLTAFGNVLGVKAPAPQAALRDTAVLAPLLFLGRDNKGPMYMAQAKAPLAEDTWSRVTICGAHRWRIPGARAVVENFATVGQSPFAVGLAAGLAFKSWPFTWPDAADTLAQRVNLFMYGTWYFNRAWAPALPSRTTLGLTLGTSLAPDKPFDDLILALSVGDLPLGLADLQGGILVSGQDNLSTAIKHPKWYVGLGFNL